jgi:hypothetical protein
MADWRLAIEKVLKSENPQKLRRGAVVPGTGHRQPIDTERKFSVEEFIRVYPVSTRKNLPAETRIDTGVLKSGEVDSVSPVSPGISIKADPKTFLPTYSFIPDHGALPSDESSHSHFSTYRDKPDKPEKPPTGPAGNDPAAWLAWMRSRIAVWQARGRSGAEVSQIVWSEAECAWSLRHHPVADPNRCAGCGRWMLDAPGMTMLGGAVVHVGGPVQLDCLIVYGEQWRQAASGALVALLKERVAIAEFEGGLDREAAEWLAWAEVTEKLEGAAP